jgi:isopentenyl-diphosphate delta-isomerase
MEAPLMPRGRKTTESNIINNEPLILVDESNRAVGTGGKMDVHRAGLLHRAFSIFVVDARGRILLQQRNARKYHSGGLWANSCCGHPRPGDRTASAARRRLREELGISPPLTFGFFARYATDLDHGMRENEFVYVYFGLLESPPQPDPAEVSQLEWVSISALAQRIKREPNTFAYWLRHYIRHHRAAIEAGAHEAAS